MDLTTAGGLSVLEAALFYREKGLSVIPVKGKQSPIAWARFQARKPEFSYIHNWHAAGLLSGVGIICGHVSENLVVVDLDGDEAVQRFELTFSHMLDTYAVRSGSGHGMHYYYQCEKLPTTTRTKGFELRADGCYVVGAPSLHPTSGQAYRIEHALPVKRVPDLGEIQAWIRGMIAQKRDTPVTSGGGVRYATLYGAAALAGECAKVSSAAEGAGNDTLFRAALKLSKLVAAGHLSEETVTSDLLKAAAGLSSRDGEAASIRTINSGLSIGLRNARGGTYGTLR